MDIKTLSRLQKLNQLNLTEAEENELMAFFAKAENDAEILVKEGILVLIKSRD